MRPFETTTTLTKKEKVEVVRYMVLPSPNLHSLDAEATRVVEVHPQEQVAVDSARSSLNMSIPLAFYNDFSRFRFR